MNNEIKGYDNFYISYNPYCNPDIGSDDPYRKCDETALVDGRGEKRVYWILYGDYREEMHKLAGDGFDAVKDFIENKPEEKSFWSE